LTILLEAPKYALAMKFQAEPTNKVIILVSSGLGSRFAKKHSGLFGFLLICSFMVSILCEIRAFEKIGSKFFLKIRKFLTGAEHLGLVEISPSRLVILPIETTLLKIAFWSSCSEVGRKTLFEHLGR
jgi:hypothetical protein